MKHILIFFAIVIVLLFIAGCGLHQPRPAMLPVDDTVADAAQIVQSFKNDYAAWKLGREKQEPTHTIEPISQITERKIPESDKVEINTEPDIQEDEDEDPPSCQEEDSVPAASEDEPQAVFPSLPDDEESWYQKNRAWLVWVLLAAICGIMYLSDLCSAKFGIPSKDTMARLSYFMLKGLPVTQRTIYNAVRLKYRKMKEKKQDKG